MHEEKLVWSYNWEKPERTVFRFVSWAENAGSRELILSHEILSHALFEKVGIELAHSILDEVKHGGAGFEAESVNESLAWLKASRE